MRESAEFMVEYEPRLVEQATLLAVRDAGEETAFRRERDRLYEITDSEAREAAFHSFHAAWFERLGLGRPIDWALRERLLLLHATQRWLVVCASTPREEGADLFVSPPGGDGPGEPWRSIVIRLRPATLLAPARALEFLRHEFLHIADMLDPRFGYEPRLPASAAGPAHDQLLKDRYRVLWDTSIDGRLARLGWAPAGIRAERLGEFRRTFPMLGDLTETAFERFFDGAALRHPDLVAFAIAPESMLDGSSSGSSPGGRCALCRFPTHTFEPRPDTLPSAVGDRIRADFPEWDPAAGLCLQCADLYRASALSSGGFSHAG